MARAQCDSAGTGTGMSETAEALRDKLLAAALPHVPFDGWTGLMLSRAAAEAGLSPHDLVRACPRGPIDLVEHWVAAADRAMLAALEATDLSALKVRERIALAIRLRLEPLAGDKEAVRRALAVQAQPAHAGRALREVYRTVSAIWYAAGDTATDWNHYSKRALLAGVYSATLLYWLNDRSDGNAATWGFVERRLGDALKLGRVPAELRRLAERLPNPFRRRA